MLVRRLLVVSTVGFVAAGVPASPALAVKKRADLVVSAVSPPPKSVRGRDRVTVVAVVRNQGKAASGSARAAVTLVSTSKAKGKGAAAARPLALTGAFPIPALKPGKSARLTATLTAPAALVTGTYRLQLCANSPVKVKETSTKNNCRTAPGTTTIASATTSPVAVGPVGALGSLPTPAPAPSGASGGPTPPATTPPAPTTPNPPTPPSGPQLPGADQPVPPAPPAPTASATSTTDAAPLGQSTKFLYTGSDPVQTGVAPSTITERRAAVVRGRVLDAAGAALPSVTVTVLDHPEYGQTVSRADGRYDLAVNGGEQLVLNLERPTYLPVQRDVEVPLRDLTNVDDVVLRQYDPNVTAVTLTGATAPQVARGPAVTDANGTRQATLLFLPGTTAKMVLPDGTERALDTLHLRATEYTVGDRGQEAMPGDLPATSAYTYAVDYSVDEAIAAGATRTRFESHPVISYTDNFLHFAVGTVVPDGAYDQQTGNWEPEGNGQVVKVLKITGGQAEVDTDGDGTADTGLGITDAERAQLAQLYTAGAELWRVPITHFTPHDLNWPAGPPGDPDGPPKDPPKPKDGKGDPADPCKKGGGSTVSCADRGLEEDLPVAGTPFGLHYTSLRSQAAEAAARKVVIPLSGATVDATALRIELTVNYAGRRLFKTFPATPNQSYEYAAETTDAYGRQIVGRPAAAIEIAYVYPAVYKTPASNRAAFAAYAAGFAGTGGTAGQDYDSGRGEIRLTVEHSVTIGDPATPPSGLGGWTLDVHHAYDPAAQSAELGDGAVQSAAAMQPISKVILPFASQSQPVLGLATDADGGLYMMDKTAPGTLRIRYRDRAGAITDVTTFPASGSDTFFAYAAIASAPGGDVYVLNADYSGTKGMSALYRVTRAGVKTVLTKGAPNTANPGTADADRGDGRPASQVTLPYAIGLASGPDGTPYIGVREGYLLHIGTDGVVHELARPGFNDELNRIAVADDGSIVFAPGNTYVYAANYVSRLEPDGTIVRLAQPGGTTASGDGKQTLGGAYMNVPLALALKRDGTPMVATEVGSDYGVSSITPGGRWHRELGRDALTPAPGGGLQESLDGAPARDTGAYQVRAIAVDPDGVIYAATRWGIRTVEPAFAGYSGTGYTIPSPDGDEIYRFDSSGRHLSTLDYATGVTKLTFGYDGAGRLAKVTDRDGAVTKIERDGAGQPTAIVAPDGLRTALSVDASGDLTTVTAPGGHATQLRYASGGLLKGETDAVGGVHTYTYDDDARLVTDTDADDVTLTLGSTSDADGTRHTTTKTARGRTRTIVDSPYRDVETFTRTTTDPAGGTTATTTAKNGTYTALRSDGSKTESTASPDTRFGPLAGYVSRYKRTLPSGLSAEATAARETTLLDASDPFAVAKITETSTLVGATSSFEYDGPTRTATSHTPTGRTATSVLDAKGRVVSVTRAGGVAPITYTYDDRSRLATMAQGGEKTTFAYDPATGEIASATDAAGNVTKYTYGADGRIATTKLPGGQTYTYARDGLGRITGVTAPGGGVSRIDLTKAGRDAGGKAPGASGATVVTYDADGAVAKRTLPSGRAVTYTSDDAGRVTKLAAADADVTATYAGATDNVATVTRTPAGGGTAAGLATTYDGSLPTSVTASGASSGRYDWTYDNRLRPVTSKLTVGAASVTQQLEYDADGARTRQGATTFTRGGPTGGISAISEGPLDVAQDWDALARVAGRTDRVNGKQAYKMTLTRDTRGHIAKKVEVVGGTTTTDDYTYDANGRLTEVTRDGATAETYTYDDDGNRTSAKLGSAAAVTSEFDTADAITKRGPATITHDADGRLKTRGSDAFSYGTRGELLSATVGATTVTYAYDGLGRRVARTAGGQTTRYLYGNPDQDLQVTAIVEPDDTLTTLDYTDVGVLYAFTRGGTRYYVSSDQVGTPRVVTDSAGTVVKAVAYTAWGEPRSDSAPSFALPIGYGTGVTDPVTGLVHLGLRDYDPTTAQFTTRDPLGFEGGNANLYSYADDDPIFRSDPIGLFSLGGTVCDVICVGTKITITDKGVSACVEGGLGAGLSFDVDPFSDTLDAQKIFIRAKATASLGPASLGITGEADDRGCKKIGPNGCLGPACTKFGLKGNTEQLKLDSPSDYKDFMKSKPFENKESWIKGFGLSGRLTAGVCSNTGP